MIASATHAIADEATALARANFVINQTGHDCPQVISVQHLGIMLKDDDLLGAICADGERWVLQYSVPPMRL